MLGAFLLLYPKNVLNTCLRLLTRLNEVQQSAPMRWGQLLNQVFTPVDTDSFSCPPCVLNHRAYFLKCPTGRTHLTPAPKN